MDLRYFKGNPIFPFEGKTRQVQAVWDMKLEKGEAVVPHWHPDGDEVYIVLDGIGEMVVGDKKNTVFEGDVVLIPSNCVHHVANKMDVTFQCVGVLLRRSDAEDPPAMRTPDEDVLGRWDAHTAISHLLQVLAFAEDTRRKLSDQKDADKDEVERQIRMMEEAVMKAVDKIVRQYRGM